MNRTSTSRRSAAALAALSLALLLGACAGGASEIGTEVRISDGSLTVTSIEKRSAEDVAELDLKDLAGQTPYFVEYSVEFNDGADSIDERLWKARVSEGVATPVNVLLAGDFPCRGLGGDISGPSATACQLIMVPEGATLESVSYGGAGTWRVEASH